MRYGAAWLGAPVLYVAAVVSLSSTASAKAPFDGREALSDPDLLSERGMFIAPDGTVIDLSIQMDTLIDGRLVLRSVLTPSGESESRLQLYTQPNETVLAPPEGEWVQAGGSAGQGVSFTFDRSAQIDLEAGSENTAPPLLVAVGGGAALPDSSGLQPVELDGNGAGNTPAGPVTVMETAQGPIVTLAGDALLVKHILGSSVANVVANTANDRAIETSTLVNLSVANTGPLVLSGSLLGLDDALLSLARRPNL